MFLELFIELQHKDRKGTIICVQFGEFSQTEHTDVTSTQTKRQTTTSVDPRGTHCRHFLQGRQLPKP